MTNRAEQNWPGDEVVEIVSEPTITKQTCVQCGHVANVQADCKMWACAKCDGLIQYSRLCGGLGYSVNREGLREVCGCCNGVMGC